jgi:hypothetical protein
MTDQSVNLSDVITIAQQRSIDIEFSRSRVSVPDKNYPRLRNYVTWPEMAPDWMHAVLVAALASTNIPWTGRVCVCALGCSEVDKRIVQDEPGLQECPGYEELSDDCCDHCAHGKKCHDVPGNAQG